MTIEESKTAEKLRSGARTAKILPVAAVESAKESVANQFMAVEDVATFSKSTMEAFLQSGSIFFHGMEELARTLVGATQAQMETSMSVAKSLIAAKTLSEFTELQNSYAKTAFDTAVSEATRLSELALRVTNETIEPLHTQMTAAIEKIAKPVLSA